MRMQLTPNRLHRNIKRCQNGKVRKCWRAQELQNIRDLDTTFRVGNTILENVDSFLYLSRTIAADDSDWPAMRRNMQRARQCWA